MTLWPWDRPVKPLTDAEIERLLAWLDEVSADVAARQAAGEWPEGHVVSVAEAMGIR